MSGLSPVMMGVAGVAPGGARVRALMEACSPLTNAGLRAVVIDGTTPGTRARELDRSGRRDLAAVLRRHGWACVGVDVFIPPEHFADRATVDRATSSVVGAIELCAEVTRLHADLDAGRGVVSVTLPEKAEPGVVASLVGSAQRAGVRLADHRWPMVATGEAKTSTVDAATVEPDLGLDPAQALGAGADPIMLAAQLASRLGIARVTDVDAGGLGIRRLAGVGGGGRLDLRGYLATLSTMQYAGHAVIDPRGTRHDPRLLVESVTGVCMAALAPI